MNVKKYLRKKNQLRYLKNLGLLYLQAKNLKYIESTEQTISLKKYSKINWWVTTLNFIEHFFILTSVINGCISISAFAFLLVISIRNMSSAINWKIV